MTSDLSRAISTTAYNTYEKRLMKEVLALPVPHHVAIIMDGNRRYAKEFGLLVSEGHEKGREKLESILEWCMELGVRILTVYAFSTENVGRDRDEVEELMRLFVQNFRNLAEDKRVHKYKIRVKVLGQKDLLPKDLREAIEYAEEQTKNYNEYFFNIAVGYGGREEIVHAIKKVAEAVKDGKMKVDDITEKTFTEFLYTKDMPDPDLVLRTSGEERISNFLLWQLAYSELYFSDVYWPGFRKIDFLRAVRSYQLRKRRFGT
ncbi:MAG: polyprenyl diphosphate synthase [Thermoplasmatota archaeon]|nr:di-trans,poly-cis-decaprenylcistransferase [Candidatus Thermoplasmatota archaeon]MBU1913751.1 di-trans,poly-cis-decaprenylcistransferase [Candidatus Thermoplasmatota archaeon]